MLPASELSNQAKAALIEANVYCQKGSELTELLKSLTEKSVVLWSKVCFLYKGYSNQQFQIECLLSSVSALSESFRVSLSDNVQKLSDREKSLEHTLHELSSVPVETAEGNHDKSSLKAFVNEDDISNLRHKSRQLMNDFKSRSRLLESRTQEFAEQVHATLEKTKRTRPSSIDGIPDQLADISTTTAESAQSMADWLESLSRHYDLSCEAEMLEDQQQLNEALSVLREDQPKVDEAIDFLRQEIERLEDLQVKIRQIYATLSKELEAASACHKGLNSHATAAMQEMVELVHREFQRLDPAIDSCALLVREFDAVVEYYHCFVRSYHAMLMEIVRRQQSQKNLEELIETLNKELRTEYTRECNARLTFLEAHKEYLPSDIWSGMGQLPAEHEVEFAEEHVPKISEDTILKTIHCLHED